MRSDAAQAWVERLGSRGLLRGGELYVWQKHWSEALTACDDLDLAVMAIEIFEVLGNRVKPRLDFIFVSPLTTRNWLVYKAETNDSASKFLGQVPRNGTMAAVFMPLSEADFGRKRQPS